MSTKAQSPKTYEDGIGEGMDLAAMALNDRLMQAGVELLATALFLIEPVKEPEGSSARQGWIGLVLDIQQHLLKVSPLLAEQLRQRLTTQ